MATLVNYTCKRSIKLKPGLISSIPAALSNPDCVTGPDSVYGYYTSEFQFILAILFSWLRALGVCFKYMYAVAMPNRAGTQSFCKRMTAINLVSNKLFTFSS